MTIDHESNTNQCPALDKRPMKVVKVVFQDVPQAKQYCFWAPENAKAGDYAIVYQSETFQREGFPFQIVKIVHDEVVDTSRATKAILGTFNEDFAQAVQARIAHMARVKAKLEVKKKQFEERAFFEMLAERDPEAKALLDELQSFGA